MNKKNQKKISFFIHLSLLLLGLLMPKFGLLVLAVSLIQPLFYMVFSMAHSQASGSDRVSFDALIFWAHALINMLAKFLPAPLFTTVFVMNMLASMHYTAHFIDSINSLSVKGVAQFAVVFELFGCYESVEVLRTQAFKSFVSKATVDSILATKIV